MDRSMPLLKPKIKKITKQITKTKTPYFVPSKNPNNGSFTRRGLWKRLAARGSNWGLSCCCDAEVFHASWMQRFLLCLGSRWGNSNDNNHNNLSKTKYINNTHTRQKKKNKGLYKKLNLCSLEPQRACNSHPEAFPLAAFREGTCPSADDAGDAIREDPWNVMVFVCCFVGFSVFFFNVFCLVVGFLWFSKGLLRF